jgi:hypothetical protein
MEDSMRHEHQHPERRFRTDGPDNEPGDPGNQSEHRGHRGPGGRRHGGPGGFGRPGGRGRGFGRPGGWQQADLPPADDAAAWLAGRLPDDWFAGSPTVTIDREEITVIGELPAPPAAADGEAAADDSTREAAASGRISRFREQTRAERMQIADEAEARYGRKIAWGASIGDVTVRFTHLSVPVMTRLRQNERRVLDTLVDAGVARSRSEALAWCVRLVGDNTEQWLGSLREAMAEVDKLRTQGPDVE